MWIKYEKEKAKLKKKRLNPKEYERQIRKVIERLGL